MRHRIAGRKLGRTSEHRKALLRNLSMSLFQYEKITTTLAKAKELRPFAEKLITLSKRETLHARRHVLREIHDRDIVAKMFDTLSARYAQRPGGYTRIIKLGPRRGDHAEMAIVELVDRDTSEATVDSGKAKRSRRTRKAAPAESSGDADSKSTDKAKKSKATKSSKTSAAKAPTKAKKAASQADPTAKAKPATGTKQSSQATSRKSRPKSKG
jgi:large subunit ribosomal protein L17